MKDIVQLIDLFIQFTALVLEAEDIIEFTEEDKKFLENFKALTSLSIISCKLKSLANFPDIEGLERVSLVIDYISIQLELSDNNIHGDLKTLAKYPKLKNIKM